MVFDGTLADLEIRGDILARMTGQHHLHDFVLPRGEARQTPLYGFLETQELADQLVPLTHHVTLRALHLGRPFDNTVRKDAARHRFRIRS
jgi:hypothetical protein